MKTDNLMSRRHVRDGLLRAVEVLGTGFLRHHRTPSGEMRGLTLEDLLHAAVTTAFRLAGLVYSPCRNPIAERLREVIAAGEEEKYEDAFGTDSFRLWEGLQAFYRKLGRTLKEPAPYLKASDYHLARAIHLLAGCSRELEGCASRRQAPPKVADIRLLGDAYEGILGCVPKEMGQELLLVRTTKPSKRKRSGSYYTPDHIVKDVIEHALGPLVRGEGGSPAGGARPLTPEGILELKVLDPAMGSGHFLLAATDHLARAYARALRREGKSRGGGSSSEDEMTRWRRLVAERCIYGVDIDPVAVELARLSLWLFTAESGQPARFLDKHLRCGNSLVGAAFGGDPGYCEQLAGECDAPTAESKRWPEQEPFHWDLEFPEIGVGRSGPGRSGPGFDAVIGNPPYLSLSGRQKAKGSEWLVRLSGSQGLKKGWVSAHGLFMLRAARLARKSGFVSMVVPDQVGHLRGYAKVRSRMLEEGRLIRVCYWGEGVFEDATTPVLTFVFEKTPPGNDCQVVVIDSEGSELRFSPRPGEEWVRARSRETYTKMLVQHQALDGFSDPGVHTGNVARKLILDRPGEGAIPVIEGKQIHPFRCDRPTRWLNTSYMPQEGEYFRISPKHVYETTDVLIRQTAARPIAARHVFHCYFRNSVLALKVPEGFSIEYLLGILNSEAVGFLYRASSFESRQRAFPQIKVGRLRGLPIPDPALHENRQSVSRIEEIVRALEARKGPIDKWDPLVQDLNTLVRELYGLTTDTEV